MRDPEAQAARAPPRGTRRRARRSGPSVPPPGPSTTVCRSTGGLAKLRRRGDQPGLELPGAAALADDEVAQHAGCGRAGRRRGCPRARAHSRTSLRAALLRSEASRQSSTSTISAQLPRRWKPSASAAVALAERVLELVAVAPLLERRARSARARSRRGRRGGAAPRRPASAFSVELALVGQPLPRRAGAGLAVVEAAVGDPVRARARAARPPAPRRSRASPWSAGRGPGRRAARRRRRRRSRSPGRRRDRPGRASRPRARAPRPASVAGLGLLPAALHRSYRCSPLTLRPRRLPRRAPRRFIEELEPRVLPALAGHKAELEIEPIYQRYADLFSATTSSGCASSAARPSGERRAARLRYLLAVRLRRAARARETRPRSAELAGLEATLEVEPGDGRGSVPRRSPIEQANEADAERRAALEAARSAELLAERLNPLYRPALERAHELCRELGWDGLRRRLRRAARASTSRRSAGQSAEPSWTRPRTATRRARRPPPGPCRAAAAGRAAPLRPAALLSRPGPRRRLPGRPAGRRRSPRRSPGSASTCAARQTSTSTPSRARPSRRAPSARPSACPTRSIW